MNAAPVEQADLITVSVLQEVLPASLQAVGVEGETGLQKR